jgi:hypothetical protein
LRIFFIVLLSTQASDSWIRLLLFCFQVRIPVRFPDLNLGIGDYAVRDTADAKTARTRRVGFVFHVHFAGASANEPGWKARVFQESGIISKDRNWKSAVRRLLKETAQAGRLVCR